MPGYGGTERGVRRGEKARVWHGSRAGFVGLGPGFTVSRGTTRGESGYDPGMANGMCGGRCGGANPVRPGQRDCLECHAAWWREHRPKWADESPERKRRNIARSTARVYRRRGTLKPVPCACGCGTPLEQLQMHHEDYSKPLDVIFCCETEHERLDAARFARLKGAELTEVSA